MRLIDEAHFRLNGIVIKQNWKFWDSENLHLCEEKALIFVKFLRGLRYAPEELLPLSSYEK